MAKKEKVKSNLPSGFEPLTRSRIDGWFILEPGNSVQGFMRGSFEVPDRFKKGGSKRVYKIELSTGETKATDPDGQETGLTEGTTCGLDEKGWLGALAEVPEGREVYVCYVGRETAKPKPGRQPAHVFEIGVVPI